MPTMEPRSATIITGTTAGVFDPILVGHSAITIYRFYFVNKRNNVSFIKEIRFCIYLILYHFM